MNAFVFTVGSGGIQTMNMLAGEAAWKENIFSARGQIVT